MFCAEAFDEERAQVRRRISTTDASHSAVVAVDQTQRTRNIF
jgi:hypothetical protein